MTDRQIAEMFVQFAVRWEPYGGADDEQIYVTFGVTAPQYRRRLWWALNMGSWPEVDASTIEHLMAYARHLDAPSKPLVGQ